MALVQAKRLLVVLLLMSALTDTQHTILALIGERIAAEGMPPSQAEIARAMGFSGVRAAQYHLEVLDQAGVIERVPGKASGLRLTPAGAALLGGDGDNVAAADGAAASLRRRDEDALLLPVLGRVAAGAPFGADPNIDEHVLLARNIFFPSPDYMLKVQGHSMRDEGIFDGDLIGVHRTPEARSGEIVVARIDDEITV